MTDDVDVLVVGAGPTGLTLACELLRHGVRCRVIERLREPQGIAKATGIMPRTLEVLSDMGCVQQFVEEGVAIRHMDTLTGDGECAMELDFDSIGTPYPFLLCQEQYRTERILGELLAQRGGRVDRGVELVSLDQDAEGVEVELSTEAGPEKMRVPYVVGCDGAHSRVRHALELQFEGAEYPQDFILGHVDIEWDYPRDHVLTFLSESGCAYANPLPGDTWLAVADLDGDQKSVVHEGTPTAEELAAVLAERVPVPLRVSNPRWTSFFRIHHRQVERYREGRVFVAGDAAHIHSPFGGQGMNTGIQDAYNLAWKLGLVLRRGAGQQLLGSYDAERRPVGKAVLRFTHQMQVSSSLRGATLEAVRSALLSCMGHVEAVAHHTAAQLGETLYSYRDGPLAEEHCDPGFHLHTDARHPSMRDCHAFHAGPHAGSRAPDAAIDGRRIFDLLRGPHFTLLLFEGAHPSEHDADDLSELGRAVCEPLPLDVRAYVVTSSEGVSNGGPITTIHDDELHAHHAYGARGQCAYLVRPDGYVAYRSQPVTVEGLGGYVQQRLAIA